MTSFLLVVLRFYLIGANVCARILSPRTFLMSRPMTNMSLLLLFVILASFLSSLLLFRHSPVSRYLRLYLFVIPAGMTKLS